MRLVALCVVMLAFSGCISDYSEDSDASTKASGSGNENVDTQPVQAPPAPELSETEKTAPREEPTREESATETSTNPPGSVKTITFANSMLSSADIFIGVPNGITVEPTTETDYSIEFTLSTAAVGPAADYFFEQYDIIMEDYIDGTKLILEASSELKPDSPLACKEISGSRICTGLTPVTIGVVAKIPASYAAFDLNTNLGSISVDDLAGSEVDAGVNSGNANVIGDFAKVIIHTNQGDVRYEGESEDVDLSANSGSVSAYGKFNKLSMHSNQGALDGEVIAQKVDVSTNTGDSSFHWTPMGSSEFEHGSNSGSLDLTIPADYQVRLELTSNLGGADPDDRFSQVEEDVWETSDYAGASERSEVNSHVNTGTQTVQ